MVKVLYIGAECGGGGLRHAEGDMRACGAREGIAGIGEARAERARERGAMRRICKHGGDIRYPASQPLVPQTECPIHVSV